tara:strand:- start:313 stop:639 length:327 start_codon:yes stop_codon:yes gene_type:complete
MQHLVFGVKIRFSVHLTAEFVGATDVVEMSMCMNDRPNRKGLFVKLSDNSWDLITWVDHNSFATFKVRDDGAVALKSPNRKSGTPKGHNSLNVPGRSRGVKVQRRRRF